MGPSVQTSGYLAGSERIDTEAVYRRAVEEFRRLREAAHRLHGEIRFDRGPILLVFAGDQHIGSPGCDIERAFAEAALVRNTVATYAIVLGDVVDNYVVRGLLHLNTRTPITILEQWELARSYLASFGGKLLACVSGNHDAWTYLLAGVDYLQEVLPGGTLYSREEMRLKVWVGEAVYRIWLRHKWRGVSIYNQTHGQERAARFSDAGYDLYVGAHTHVGGLYREFILHGRRRAAIQVGTYKLHDEYALEEGYPPHDESTAVGVVLDEAGHFFGAADLRALCAYIKTIWDRSG